MKILKPKSMTQKIIIAICTIVMVFNFIYPNISSALDIENVGKKVKDTYGGILFAPIQFLVLKLGDTAMWIFNMITGQVGDNIITISKTVDFWDIAKYFDPSYLAYGANAEFFSKVLGKDTILYANLGRSVFDPEKEALPDTLDIPLFRVTPESIFTNSIPFLDINIINPQGKEYQSYGFNDKGKIKDNTETSVVKTLQPTISSWYKALRDLALVAMLSILVYIGIRIIISSSANEKSKYKEMIKDWLVGICLLFFMHYIMAFSITMIEQFTNSLCTEININKINIKTEDYKVPNELKTAISGLGKGFEATDDHITILADFTSLTRFKAQVDSTRIPTNYATDTEKSQMAYTLVYGLLVIYTGMFLYQYIKRLIYIIFLTMVAPLVAATYPLDKLGDGKSQAFNMWLKEYIFTLLIQPLHLLIYVLLVGSVQDLASQYIIYPLVVLGFMLQAEKILKKFFNFRAEGPNYMGGFVGGAAVMTALSAATKAATGALGGGSKKGGGSSSDSSDSAGNGRIRKADSNMPDLLVDGDAGEQEAGTGSEAAPEPDTNRHDIFPEDDMGDENEFGDLTDAALDARMVEIEDNDYNFASNEDWMRLEQEKQRREGQRKLLEAQRQQELERRRKEQQDKIWQKMDEKENKPDGKAFKGAKKIPAKSKFSIPRAKIREKLNNPKLQAALKTADPYLKNLGMGVLKTGVKAYGAATLGTVGMLAGLASDDYDKVFTYGAAGAIGGAKVADVGMNKISGLPSAAYKKQQELEDEYYKNLYADDPDKYQEYLNKKADQAYRRDKNEQKKFKEAFGTDKTDNGKGQQQEAWRVAFDQSMNYRKNGVTDTDTIISAMKAKVRGVSDKWDDNQRIAAAKYSRHANNIKDVQNIGDLLKEKYGNKISEDQIKIQKNLVRKIKKLD